VNKQDSTPPDLERDYLFATRRLVMYQDLNAAGMLFGGELMRWLDEATAQIAARIMSTRSLVTKKFGEVVFDHPGRLGDSVEFWCRVEKTGTTSLTLDARVLVRQVAPETLTQICQANVVYVALDKAGRPMPWKKG
jgi:acyl-CoA thioesterase YciA